MNIGALDTGLSSSGRPHSAAAGVVTSGGQGHGVSWAAIFAGATAAAALSLILLVLGVGLGLSSLSPWTTQGAGAAAVGVGSIVWLLFVALAASGMGGYLAGRLRERWIEVHVDEVYFRDTAHGFLAWAVATLFTAALLTSTVSSILGAGATAGGAAIGAAGTAATSMAAGSGGAVAGQTGSGGMDVGYFTDALLRPMAPSPGASSAPGASNVNGAETSTAEAGRILARSMSRGSLTSDDTRYLGQLIAQRTAMSQQDAEKRVADVYGQVRQSVQEAEAKAKDVADKARKAAAYASLWLFVSLLLGAFIASLAATYGGRRRDL